MVTSGNKKINKLVISSSNINIKDFYNMIFIKYIIEYNNNLYILEIYYNINVFLCKINYISYINIYIIIYFYN